MSLFWLPNRYLKDVPLPKVIFEENIGQPYGGYYTSGTREIVIVANDDLEASTIAHEFRHYVQYISGWNMENIRWEHESCSYEESIKHYFTHSRTEYDALRFEHKVTKNWLNDWWLRKLVHET